MNSKKDNDDEKDEEGWVHVSDRYRSGGLPERNWPIFCKTRPRRMPRNEQNWKHNLALKMHRAQMSKTQNVWPRKKRNVWLKKPGVSLKRMLDVWLKKLNV
jgi:hypothetical protein